jgi:uncharacterized protein (TIGR00369 family)
MMRPARNAGDKDTTSTMTTTDLHARSRAILEVALNHHLGLVFDGIVDGVARAHFVATPATLAFGGVHGGVLYALTDAVCMLALLPALDPSQHAVTHDLYVSVMRPVPPGAVCRLSARVLRHGRTLAFLESTAEVDGKIVASGRVTKSIVGARAPS